MATNELRKRANWQTTSGTKALKTEDIFCNILQNALNIWFFGQFVVDKHPNDFSDIYSSFELPQEDLDAIYNVSMHNADGSLKYHWGITMDFAIRNRLNGKVLYGEIKRQDGWIETTKPAAGRGNAHERSAKYFTPGLMHIIREKSHLPEEILPFWLVIVGDITRDPRRNREIAYWFQGYESNFFMWRDTNDVDALLNFFENNLLPYLL